jgi:type VI secretion system protein ImpH
LAALAALSFPAGEVIELQEPAAENEAQATDDALSPPKLTVGFMGLFGPSGVLPHHDTQRIIDAGNKKNPERDFLNAFNHRILSLFYRASTKYRLPFAYETNYREPQADDDAITRAFYSLAGMGTAGLRGRLEILDELSIEFCGHFGHHPKNASSLQRLLQDYFNLPINIEQFTGQWLYLSHDNTSAMPSRQNPLGQNCALGQAFILGDRVWDIAGKFRIRIGPLTREQFEAFLPENSNLIEAAQIAQLYAGNQLDFDVQLELLAAEVPPIQLGGNSRLGRNTWLFANQPQENKTEAVFSQSGLPLAAIAS